MKQSNIDRRKRQLSAKAQAYVNNRAKGLPRDQSALMAGYAESSVNTNKADQIEKMPTVAAELSRIRKETAENAGITKEDVVGMLVEAANMAKIMSEPAGLVAAARELGKMLGFYAPEVKKVLTGIDKKELQNALSQMSDEELLKIANARTIDGEAVRVEEPAQNA